MITFTVARIGEIIGITHEDFAGLLRDADRKIEAGFKYLKVFVNGIRDNGSGFSLAMSETATGVFCPLM